MRVVSLLPSATEMVYALGVEPVGVSHECDYPPEAGELPTVIDSCVDANGSSGEIDQAVLDAVEDGGVYEIDRDTLARLDPDIVVSQGICDVCAVDDSEVRAAVEELELGAEVVATDPHSLADVFADIKRLGRVLDCESRAESVVADLEARVERVRETTPDDGPDVAVLDWLDPVMVSGHWVPEMISIAGGSYELADPGDRSTPREWKQIRAADPDVLIAAPCGFGLEQIEENVTDLTARPGWNELAAVREGRVYAMDGHHYVNRPGPRLVDTLEYLAGVVHPGTFEVPAAVAEPLYDGATDDQTLTGSATLNTNRTVGPTARDN